MQILIPMAGAGRRFAEKGFSLPKPLIPVGGVPMVVRAVRDLPPASRHVFVCHPDHLANYPVRETLEGEFPGSVVISTPGLTEGQACSVRLGTPFLDPDESVLVAACDNTHVYDLDRFQALTETSAIDAILWTYRRDPRVLINPRWCGWVKTAGGWVSEVSCKVPISDSPMADHAISGTFWFRSARLLEKGIDALVRDNQRVNNEFYLDSVPNVLIAWGNRVVVLEVDKYVGWGTPDDLQDYFRWERHFGRRAA
jgi:NDP-sugar pyrophosphorylase family protein